MKKGLVLEGGGMRGLFTAGVMDVMMEHGIRFDGIVGVSAGATFGCNYKSHQPGRVLRYNVRFKDDPRYMGLRSLFRTGDLVGADFSYHTLPNELDIFDRETYKSDPTEFHVVCTDAETGEPVYHRIDVMDDDGLDWIRASASMPLVSRPVRLGGRLLLDGGIADSIPLRYFQIQGFERNVVILTQPKGFFKKRTKLMPLFHIFMRRYPAIVRAMSRRHLMYNDELSYLAEQERLGNILLIYPQDTLPIGRTEQDEAKMRYVYAMGREAGEAMMTPVKEFL
ncbi:MAG: patatin family protein [Bacteroidaceae bacterium]|nr:patatin family protein [Bacteroidaceae bacterium]